MARFGRRRQQPTPSTTHAHAPFGRDRTGYDDLAPDALLALVTVDDIAEAWACYTTRRPQTSDDPDWWAIAVWHRAGTMWSAPELVIRHGLSALVRELPDDLLRYAGVGPLEDFLNGAGEDRIVWVEQEAARSPRFRTALQHVWPAGWPAQVLRRIEAAARAQLGNPPT